MNSWDFGAVCGDLPAVCVPEQADSGRSMRSSPAPRRPCIWPGTSTNATFPDLTRILARAAAAGAPRIHVDLADVQYCDVAGLRAIISLVSGQGEAPAAVDEIVFTHLPGPLQRVLSILGWDAAPGVILDGATC